jgi:hypothetical protein
MGLRLRPKFLLICIILLAAALGITGTFVLSKLLSLFRAEKEEITIVRHFSFSTNDSLKEWDEKVLNKKVSYEIESSGNESYIHAVSNSTCSALYHKIKLDAGKRPILTWKWRISNFPNKESPDNLLNKEEDDFAARMYVIFPALFFSNSKVLEYIWANNLEVGTISSSPYSKNIKLIVVESGANKGDWVFEERDLYEDYILAFNAKPKANIGAIAFMCDSDSTESNAEAFFDEIKIIHKK